MALNTARNEASFATVSRIGEAIFLASFEVNTRGVGDYGVSIDVPKLVNDSSIALVVRFAQVDVSSTRSQ